MPVAEDLLSAAHWVCTSTAPGVAGHPGELEDEHLDWIPTVVPGTAAGALRAAGEWSWGHEDQALLDGRDWWFRTRLAAPGGSGPWELCFGGLATLADVWLNGEHLAHSENMFVPVTIELGQLPASLELIIRCAALDARLATRHPRPRFKSRLVRSQALRWYRTTLLGRMPGWSRWAAPVGPWRPVTLAARPAYGAIEDLTLDAQCLPDGGGEVRVAFVLRGGERPPRRALLEVDGVSAPLGLLPVPGGTAAVGHLTLAQVKRWWPHTHGPQPLSTVTVDLDGDRRELRRVGFRTIELDRDDGAFTLRVNGRELFCRGVTWGPADAVSLTAGEAEQTAELELVRDAGLNLVRLGGYGVYADAGFWDRCDALGIMVWQDCMIAAVDPPDEEAWLDELAAELRAQFGALQGRPSLVMACGSSETYQQGSMLGLEPERYRSEVLESWIPEQLRAIVPDIPYVPSSPSGGEPPIRTDEGVTHYFGVGAYLRSPEDARLAGVRFAAECLSFANPPERATVERVYGSAAAAGHDPRWKLAVARDAGTSWDFEDVRDHYVRELFGVDPLRIRYGDPEHALDLGRAAVVELVGRVLGDWRDAGSGCAGAVMLAWRDLWPGAGWGVLDADGIPKAAFYALARASAPRAIILRDRGLNGLVADVFNDGPDPLEGTLRLSLFDAAGVETEVAEQSLALAAHAQGSYEASVLLGGFRDLTAAFRFSPSWPDAVSVRLSAADGALLGRAVFLPGGCARPRNADVGLRAVARPAGPGAWELTVSTERLATFVSVDAPGLIPSDSWFHLAPGESVELLLRGEAEPRGVVRALNSTASARITSERA